MPDWYKELEALFEDRIGKGEMAGTAYDTAWVASIPDPQHPDRPAFPQTLEWLRLHQHSDGSWGAQIESHQDRVLSTLVATIVVAEWEHDDLARYQVEAGLKSIWRRLVTLDRDTFELVGFELILPTLLNRARSLEFKLPYSHFDLYAKLREKKIALIPADLLYSRAVTSTFSLEFMGDEIDKTHLNDDLQERNGSIATSPSATSYLLRHTQNDRAMAYIQQVVKRAHGAIPALDSIDVFEIAWAIYNLYWIEEKMPPWIAPQLKALRNAWTARGVAANSVFSVCDVDDTAMAFMALARSGAPPDPNVFSKYELDDHFLCYPYERTPSISAHVHLLEALTVSEPFEGRERMIRKAKNFLIATRKSDTYWSDKWHASPYYTTAHAIISLSAMAPEILEETVQWVIQTQRDDGSWGYYDKGTAEETAYCLQALILYRKRVGPVPGSILDKACHYLTNSTEYHYAHYKSFWAGKTLYSPTWVNHTSVLSGLALYEREAR